MKTNILWVVFVALALACAGCTPVKPWQKGNLAKSQMAFDPDPLDAKFRQSVYDSKEGSFGGYGLGAGGCGCN
ncbi:MAG: DUF4266 domain-containing protein [Deltaproteobacteria bacterium]|nr:DUF4266 domain-containing protein [Deltaproteobacteria bacterium]